MTYQNVSICETLVKIQHFRHEKTQENQGFLHNLQLLLACQYTKMFFFYLNTEYTICESLVKIKNNKDVFLLKIQFLGPKPLIFYRIHLHFMIAIRNLNITFTFRVRANQDIHCYNNSQHVFTQFIQSYVCKYVNICICKLFLVILLLVECVWTATGL